MDKALDFRARESKLEEVVEKVDKLKKTIPKPLKKALKWLFGHLREKIHRIIPKNKGSLKDPFFYLGVISVILLSILSFAPHHFWPEVNSIAIAKNLNASLIEPSNQPENGGEPFLGPIKNSLEESPDFLLIQKSSLVAFSPPILVTPQVLGSIFGDSESELGTTTREEIIEYTVQPGDTLGSIAAHFNISLNTLLWANDLNQKSTIKLDQKFLILQVSGVMHLVKKGDTVGSIAEKYKTDAEKIIEFNDLSGDGDIVVKEVLIIPDGKPPVVSIVQEEPPFLSTSNSYDKSHTYPWGQCTWWVAQRRTILGWGNAINWLDEAIRSGFKVCKGSNCIPQVGAVISLSGNRYYGHVGYVEEVRGDKVVFSEMNYIGLGRMNYRTLRIGSPSIKGYIY